MDSFNISANQTTWDADIWHHVIASISSANGARLRLDNGTAITSGDTSAACNGGDFIIGNITNPGSTSTSFEIANVIVGTDDLTTDEETALYEGTAPGDEVNLWYIDEGTGTTITDYGSGGNDGTAGTGTSWETSTRPCKFTLFIDGTVKDSFARSTSVTDNGNGWSFLRNDAMMYMEYHKIWIDDVLKQHIEWEYSTTFSDLSGNSHDTTPTFRTSTSNANVTATLTSFQPVSTARGPAYTVSSAPDFISANITVEGDFQSGDVPAGGPPGSDLPDEAAEEGNIPNVWIWGIIGGFTVALSGLGISYLEKRWGSGNGTLLLRIVIAILTYGLLITWQKFDWWMLVFYLIIAFSCAMASRHTEWGGSVGQLNLIGFLAMSWIGLTVVNNILEGQFITSSEASWVNNLMFTQEFQLFGIFKIPVMNFQFFTQGIPMLLRWDYSFLGGNAQLIQYLFYSLTAVASFIIFGLTVGLLYNYFRRS